LRSVGTSMSRQRHLKALQHALMLAICPPPKIAVWIFIRALYPNNYSCEDARCTVAALAAATAKDGRA
jgi:hypothetical protein